MRKKTSGLCILILGASLFLNGCDKEKPKIPPYTHFNVKPKHGAAVLDDDSERILGYWNAEKNKMTAIKNFQNLPEGYTKKWGVDNKGRRRNFVYDNEGNHIGYLKYIDPRREKASQEKNFVETEHDIRKLIKEKRYFFSIQIFTPDTTEIVPRK